MLAKHFFILAIIMFNRNEIKTVLIHHHKKACFTRQHNQLLDIFEQDKNNNITTTTTKCRHSNNNATALINAYSSKAAETFDGIVPQGESYARKYSQYDVVFDVYHQDSLKRETGQKRRTGVHQ